MKFDKALLARCLAEIAGTALLLCIGCSGCAGLGSIVFPRSLLMISISFGLVVMISVHTFIMVSGSHINPSVSIAFYMCGKSPLDVMLLYIVCQFFGGIVGYGLLMLALPASVVSPSTKFCATVVHSSINVGQAFAMEFVLTAVLIYFCCAVWDPRNTVPPDSVAVRFGLLIAGLVLSGAHYTGASLNIARSLPPALFLNIWADLWIYPLAQVLASVVVPLAWKYLHSMPGQATAASSDDA